MDRKTHKEMVTEYSQKARKAERKSESGEKHRKRERDEERQKIKEDRGR
jgi:hypothetical protein